MFWVIILPIFRMTRLCVTACGIMHPRCCRPATSWVHYTTSCNKQSSAPEDGQNKFPKHVELIGIINKMLFLNLVGCLYYLCLVQFNQRQQHRHRIRWWTLPLYPTIQPCVSECKSECIFFYERTENLRDLGFSQRYWERLKSSGMRRRFDWWTVINI